MDDKPLIRKLKPENQPWHRFPFVWLLFALPASAVIAGLATFYIAANTDDGVVSDDYYTRGKEINKYLGRDQAASRMGLSAQIFLGADRRSIRILPSPPLTGPLQIRLMHPTRAGFDQSATLLMQSPQIWSAMLPSSLDQNHWQIELGDAALTWRLRSEWNIRPNEGIILKSQ